MPTHTLYITSISKLIVYYIGRGASHLLLDIINNEITYKDYKRPRCKRLVTTVAITQVNVEIMLYFFSSPLPY